MTTLDFAVTYEHVTPESSEYGDVEDRGYALESGTLRECLDLIPQGCYCEPDSSPCVRPRWLTFYETNNGTREFYERGLVENLSLHIPESVTDSSARRIARLVGAYGF